MNHEKRPFVLFITEDDKIVLSCRQGDRVGIIVGEIVDTGDGNVYVAVPISQIRGTKHMLMKAKTGVGSEPRKS